MRDARGEAGAPKLLRSYGRRKGKPLSARKERLITELLPRLRLNLKEPPPRDLFSVPVKEVWLEIGFGSGEHLLHRLRAFRQRHGEPARRRRGSRHCDHPRP
jgi:tRNA (guanine-N7-)-methyltransferase